MSGLQAGGLHAADRFTLTPRVTGGDASLLVPMAAELVALKVDLIAAIGPAAVRAARTATPSIPIVANDGIRRWRAASLPASSSPAAM